MKINTKLFILIIVVIFLIGIVVGGLLGILRGQMLLFEGIATITSHSNINFTIAINETNMINEMNKTIFPHIINSLEEQKLKEMKK